jgi:hypothetical protein
MGQAIRKGMSEAGKQIRSIPRVSRRVVEAGKEAQRRGSEAVRKIKRHVER